MPLPKSAWLSLPETVQVVIERSGEAEDRVRSTLIEAALAGTITATGCRHLSGLNLVRYYSRYFAHPVLVDREVVPASAWGTAMISWAQSHVDRYDLVRFERAGIHRWLDTAEPQHPQNSAPDRDPAETPEAPDTAPGAPPDATLHAAPDDTTDQPKGVLPAHGSVIEFVMAYISTERAAGRGPSKDGLEKAWQPQGTPRRPPG
jgi:hypothetical protein